MSLNPREKAEAIKKQLIIINEFLKKPQNKYCADCKRPSPTWASVNLGVFVCINCSGCHREIGVHITKIRSTNLDVWPQDALNNFKLINNKIANKYWEHKLKKFDYKSIQKDNNKLINFIRDKYENKKWVDKKKKEDPMSLIIKGKIKKYKKYYYDSEDEEEEEESEDSREEEKNEKKKRKKKSDDYSDGEYKKKKKKHDSDDEKKKWKKKEGEDEEEEEEIVKTMRWIYPEKLYEIIQIEEEEGKIIKKLVQIVVIFLLIKKEILISISIKRIRKWKYQKIKIK